MTACDGVQCVPLRRCGRVAVVALALWRTMRTMIFSLCARSMLLLRVRLHARGSFVGIVRAR